MRARSALFDLYGDYLRQRGGRAPIAALVRLLAPTGVAGPAVRTAVSRMVKQGWLRPVTTPAGPGYASTAKATRRLDEAGARIYRTSSASMSTSWDGSFDLLVLDGPSGRTERSRLAANLRFLGYGPIDATTWLAPRPADEVAGMLADAGVRSERFRAEHAAGIQGAVDLVHRAWDLAAIAAAYTGFMAELAPVVAAADEKTATDEAAYAARFALVHAWRTFLFRDPQLPPELLPEHWPGTAAAAFFDLHATRLRPAADRYVDRCLESVPT
jgi:phenylacetic acid degradation operon negative regulatory protein